MSCLMQNDHVTLVLTTLPFRMKNGFPTFHRVIKRTFRKYLNNFKKIFLDDFLMYNDIETHLQKMLLKMEGVHE